MRLFETAVQDFARRDVAFAVHLGDIVDGKQRLAAEAEGRDAREASHNALARVLAACTSLRRPFYHVIGNHCLYNFDRDTLSRELQIQGQHGRAYYSFCPHPAWRIVVLDTFDQSVIGWPRGSEQFAEAEAMLRQHNTNDNWNDPPLTVHAAIDKRWVAYGGGIGQQQLAWLRDELAAAEAASQRVLVFSHCTIHPDSTCGRYASLIWNYHAVLEVLWGCSAVVATFSGHVHVQGHTVDSHGVHHHALPALLETPPGEECHGVVQVFADSVRLEGVGVMDSHEMPVHKARTGAVVASAE